MVSLSSIVIKLCNLNTRCAMLFAKPLHLTAEEVRLSEVK
jgi:hypothetical protein